MSLYIPAKDNLDKVNALLVSELSGAAGIKSKQTKNSVSSAITSTIQSKLLFWLTKLELKLYRSIPPNGLVLFCGVIELGDGKTEKKITLDLEPFKPINVFTYRCQPTFETAPL